MFEHIDQIIQKNKTVVENNIEHDIEKDIINDFESIIRASIITQLYSMSDDSSLKENINKLKSIDLDYLDVMNVVYNQIKPVVDLSEYCNKIGQDVKMVPLIVFEICKVMSDAYNNRLTNIFTINEKVNINENNIEEEQERTKKANISICISVMKETFELYGYSSKDANDIINVSIDTINKYGINNIAPNISELSNVVFLYNEYAELNDKLSIKEILEKVRGGNLKAYAPLVEFYYNINEHETIMLYDKTVNNIIKFMNFDYDDITNVDVLNDWQWSKSKSYLGNSGIAKYMMAHKFKMGALLTLSAITAIATIAYKNSSTSVCKSIKNKSKHYECLANCCDKAISAIRSQKGACENHKNPDKCRKSIDNIINRWEKRKEMYIEKSKRIGTNK